VCPTANNVSASRANGRPPGISNFAVAFDFDEAERLSSRASSVDTLDSISLGSLRYNAPTINSVEDYELEYGVSLQECLTMSLNVNAREGLFNYPDGERDLMLGPQVYQSSETAMAIWDPVWHITMTLPLDIALRRYFFVST
jgi:hypothetical protein